MNTNAILIQMQTTYIYSRLVYTSAFRYKTAESFNFFKDIVFSNKGCLSLL